MPTRVRKAVFPVAGLGTRLLPATKSIPKEMITIVDRPTLARWAASERPPLPFARKEPRPWGSSSHSSMSGP